MNLDQVTIEIRPRRPWEAIDLGLLMARRWWWPMMKIWLLLTLPLFALLSFLPSQWLWLNYLLLWWLKPLFERPLLHILSQAVFNQLPDTRATLRTFFRLARPQLLRSLTWRRLSPTRSMDLPLVQLEGLKGAQRKERLLLLHREDASPAAFLTIIGFHIELALAASLLMLLYALVPSETGIDWRGLFTSKDHVWFIHLGNSCSYIALSLVAPFYVACGFSLYLNRRIKLEAWDIDIAFRRIINKRISSPRLLLVLPLVVALGFLPAPDLAAETAVETAVDSAADIGSDSSANSSVDSSMVRSMNNSVGSAFITTERATETPAFYNRESAKTQIATILEGEDFHQKQLLRYPVLAFDDERPSLWDWLFEKLPALERLSSLPFARILEIIFWMAVLGLIGVLVLRYRHWLAAYLPHGLTPQPKRNRPATLFGLDLTRASLPGDISAAALKLWHSHQQRAALALLYRASLSHLIDAGLEIAEGHTEMECLAIVESQENHAKNRHKIIYFAELTRAWQRLAYGHLAPDTGDGERLCLTWNDVWNTSGSSPAQGQLHG